MSNGKLEKKLADGTPWGWQSGAYRDLQPRSSCACLILGCTRGFYLPKSAVTLILCHFWAIVPFQTTNDEIESPATRGHVPRKI